MRYGFGTGSAKLTESIIYAHAALFMLAAAWTLRENGHVRVDIFYADAPPRRKALVDLCGALLLLIPFALSLLISVAALCRALLVDPGALARNQRLALRLSPEDADSGFRAAARAARHRAGDPRALQTLVARGPFMTFPEIFAVALVVAVCVTLMAGYPVAFTLGGVSLAFALLGHLLGLFDLEFPRRVSAARLRRDDQRGAARDPALYLHGRDAGALAHRGGSARNHGAAVRPAARRAWAFRS